MKDSLPFLILAAIAGVLLYLVARNMNSGMAGMLSGDMDFTSEQSATVGNSMGGSGGGLLGGLGGGGGGGGGLDIGSFFG